jgi:hypothetical protein
MFGKRPDGTKLVNLSHMRAFMPFISPRRNESLVYYSTTVDVDRAFELLQQINAKRNPNRPITLFHLYIRALAMAFHARPNVNRFIAGGRLWQRNHVAITFSAKQEIIEGAPLITMKRVFPESEGLEEMVDEILDTLIARRGGERTSSDSEVNLALMLPVICVRFIMWFLHRIDMMGLLPWAMIDDDPLYTSIFIANLGSVGLDAGYHHLWEHGTCSVFGVMGRIHENAEGKRVMEIKYSYDERVEDGLYAGVTMEQVRESLEQPERLL